MNAEEYIESGILDVYVLGGLSPEESLEVEAMALKHAEVAEEIAQIRNAFEAALQAGAIMPSDSLKKQILDNVQVPLPREETGKKEAKVINMPNFGYWAIAASWFVGLLFGGLALYYRQQWKRTEGKLLALETQNKELADNYNLARFGFENANKQLSSLSDTSLHLVALKQLPDKPNAYAQIFWSASKKEVYLSTRYLPVAPKGKQYQLWAIVDGKPVDAGVVPATGILELYRMKDIGNASAFAITLEQEGGSVVPTLEAMYVMGGV